MTSSTDLQQINPEMADAEHPEWTDEMFASAKCGAKVSVGRPRLKNPKQPIFIRLSPEVAAYFKAGGKGW